MKTKSVIAGEYTAPPAHGPMIAETCGTTPEARVLRRKMSAYPASETTPSWILAPPESFSPMIGTPVFIARSITLQILRAYASEREPPKTVKSWANTKAGRPWIRPDPVTTPSPRIFWFCISKSWVWCTTNLSISVEELRPLVGQAHALTEDVRAVTREAGRELERIGAVTEKVESVADGFARFVWVLGGLARAGQIAGVAAGVKKGVEAFVHRLRKEQGDDHE